MNTRRAPSARPVRRPPRAYNHRGPPRAGRPHREVGWKRSNADAQGPALLCLWGRRGRTTGEAAPAAGDLPTPRRASIMEVVFPPNEVQWDSETGRVGFV